MSYGTYMQNLITHICDPTAYIPRTTKNIITYDPLEDDGDDYLPRPKPFSTHPHLRPTVKREILGNPHLPGNPLNPGDLEYDDLLELYGYDEERGLSEIILEKGTEIEIAIEDDLGAITWIPGRISSIQKGSLEFQACFRGCRIDSGTWTDTEQSRDGSHLASSPRTAETVTISIHHTHYTRVLTMAPPPAQVTLAPTPTSRGLDLQET